MASLLFKRVALVVVAAFVVLLFLSFAKTKEVKTQQEAISFVADDIASDPQASGSDGIFMIFSTTRLEETGEWKVVAKITTNAHSACPEAFLRTYYLMPIRHEPDKPITAGCKYGTPIAFPEEAIIASASSGVARKAHFNKGTACAYAMPFDPAKAVQYCPGLDTNKASAFIGALSVPGKWVVEWTDADGVSRIVLDEHGNITAEFPPA